MQWQLNRGDRVRFRELGAGRAEMAGRVGKTLHILDAQLQVVPVYLVESEAGQTVVLGDGEILEKLADKAV
jgi:hypothetical protein